MSSTVRFSGGTNANRFRSVPPSSDRAALGPYQNQACCNLSKIANATSFANTVGLDERAWLDNAGLPKSFQARIAERYTRTAYNTIELQMTLYDPEYYTATYVGGKKTYKIVPDDAITYFGWKGLFAGISEGICAPMNEVEGYNKGFRDPGQAKPK